LIPEHNPKVKDSSGWWVYNKIKKAFPDIFIKQRGD